MPKKDLAALAVMQGNCYVARVAFGADDKQTLAAFREAEAFDGPALIIAYSHCIAHGYDLAHGLEQQKLAAQTGYWPLFRFNPALKAAGQPPLHLDSKPPSAPVQKYMYNETRFTMLAQAHPAEAKALLDAAQRDVTERWQLYERLAAVEG
jgi:pyruvate-ferredoxin/flavodoxin oxidoreductase